MRITREGVDRAALKGLLFFATSSKSRDAAVYTIDARTGRIHVRWLLIEPETRAAVLGGVADRGQTVMRECTDFEMGFLGWETAVKSGSTEVTFHSLASRGDDTVITLGRFADGEYALLMPLDAGTGVVDSLYLTMSPGELSTPETVHVTLLSTEDDSEVERVFKA